MGRKVFVIGVGMTKFEKPGSKDWDYPDMAKEAGSKALADAGIAYDAVEQAAVGYCYGDSTCGQRAVYQLGLTGIPVYNVNNNCATGSTALFMGKQFVEGGLADCVLALGFEKMEKGSLGAKYMDRTNPMDKQLQVMVDLRGFESAPPTAQFFGNAGREHMERWHDGAAVRQDRLEEPQAFGEQPVLAVPGRILARADHERADGLRAAHQAAVLPDLGRRRRRDPRQRGLRAQTTCRPRRSRFSAWR
jgi:acetyl-CoA acetyltransferase